jgi:hypothetical protein
MKVTRKWTKAGQDPFATTEWVKRSSRISNPDGSVVFEMADAEVPKGWSQLATDIMVSKYFRKAGVPQLGDDGEALTNEDGTPVLGPERSARQVIGRLAGCWKHWGETHNYFDSPADAQAFYDELAYMLTHQMCGAELAAVVQHRAELGLRHQRPGPGALGTPTTKTGELKLSRGRVHPPAAARVLYPVVTTTS